MRARFLGKDPGSQVDNSPTLFANDRTDRTTYIVQGWRVTDSEALAQIRARPVPRDLDQNPKEVMQFYVRRYQEDVEH